MLEYGEDPARGAHLGEHIGVTATKPEAKRGIRVGLRIAPGIHELPERLAQLPELAVAAEALGFELLVIPERLSALGGFPAALPVCAAAAAATQRLRIATGLLALPLHHPLRVAEDAATLDALSAGRFELGVGLGAEVEAFGGFGLDRRERAARFEEALEVVRRAWADGPVRFRGQHFRCEEVEVYPKPFQPGGPPLWLGARGVDALARAAQLGCGVVLELETDPAPYLAAWDASGRDPGEVRIALLLEPEQLAHPSLPRRIAGAGARADVWLATSGDPEEVEGLASRAAALRTL
jgi:alkanesulfonate monooxygenase SsuD/methylene tetrahydromethanopterin reductase-like flavin-dependent oxidoreductase (luciferase family)